LKRPPHEPPGPPGVARPPRRPARVGDPGVGVGWGPPPRDGGRGGASAFPGEGRVGLPGTEALLTPTAPFTAALWIDAATTSSTVEIPLSKPYSLASSADTLSLTIDPAGSVQYETTGLAATPQYFPPSTPLIRGAWHHVALSFDGTKRVLYVDGQAFENDAPSLDGMLPVAIGADLDRDALVFGFTGGLDDFRIYDRALAPDEVAHPAR